MDQIVKYLFFLKNNILPIRRGRGSMLFAAFLLRWFNFTIRNISLMIFNIMIGLYFHVMYELNFVMHVYL